MSDVAANRDTDPEVFVTFQFPIPLEPEQRGERLEEPMDEFLEQHNLGEYDGGGTFLDDASKRICGCEITLLLHDRADIARVAARFNELGAPKGSTFQEDGEDKQEFGSNDCLALSLDMDLPDEVMDAHDLGDLYQAIDARLAGVGQWLASEQQDRRYVLYVYGPSFAAMAQCLQPLLDTEPLLQNAQTQQIVAEADFD